MTVQSLENKIFLNSTQNSPTIQQINDSIIEAIQDIKGKDIIKMDLQKLDKSPADFFIICSGESSTQVNAIANSVYKKVKEDLNVLPNHVEGKNNAQWVLVDYFNTVVHIFHPEAREFYELEDLWSDAESTTYENL